LSKLKGQLEGILRRRNIETGEFQPKD